MISNNDAYTVIRPEMIRGFSEMVMGIAVYDVQKIIISNGRSPWWKTFLKTYISYAGTGIVLSNILLAIWIEVFGISKVIAPLINLMVTIPINFLINW